MAAQTLQQKIKSKIRIAKSGCWFWTGYVAKNGYGSTSVIPSEGGRYKTEMAHRASYLAFVGPIPKGLQIDHLCKIRKCVNPDHLEAVTPKENVLRSNANFRAQLARTHCPANHEYTADNLYTAKTKSGGVSRSCKTCAKSRTRVRYSLKKLALGGA